MHGRRAGDPYLEDTSVETGTDLALIDTLRQRHAPPERTIAPLPHVIARTLTLLFGFALPGDGQYPIVQRDVYVPLLHTGQLRPDDYVPVFLQYVEHRRPPGRLFPLLPPTPAGEAAEHLVEHAVHLALHVVETTVRSHGHRDYLLTLSGSLLEPPLSPALFTELPTVCG